jgi:CRISPR-associated protein Cas1
MFGGRGVKVHLNTLFVTRENTYLARDGMTVDVRQEGKSLLRVPLHNLDGIVALGWDIGASNQLMAACAEAGVTLSFCSPFGKFMAAVRGFATGNILLRRAQYRVADTPAATAKLSAAFVSAKLANCRTVLLRAARDHGEDEALTVMARRLRRGAEEVCAAADGEVIRGIEGEGAAVYFSVFGKLLQTDGFGFRERVRRPPTDPVNALLSFAYAMLAHDCRSALESVGLDPQCGFLHRDRPGRASLALDLMEEFRPVLADRAALTVLNRRQLALTDFTRRETGAVELTEAGRKVFLTHWQERKQDEITHPFLEEKISVGLLPFVQARLLARAVRGDLDAYPAYLWR